MTNEFATAIAEQIERLVDAKLRQYLENSPSVTANEVRDIIDESVMSREDIVEMVQDEVRYRLDDIDLTDAVRDVLVDARIEL